MKGHLVGPDYVTVGEPVTISGSGFPPGRRLQFVADPSKLHRFQGYGIIIRNHIRTDAEGRFRTTFDFPPAYANDDPENPRKRFTPGMAVTLVSSPFPANDLEFMVAG